MAVADDRKEPPDHVVSDTNTPLYDMVRFWGRKPHNLVSEYVRHYTDEGDVVFDPFSGSGVTALEALRAGRRGVYNDLNPVFRFIGRTSAEYVDLDDLEDGFDAVVENLYSRKHPLRDGEDVVKRSFDWLYATECRQCGYDGARILETEATRVYAPADEDEAPTGGIAGDGTLDRLAREILDILAGEGRVSHSDLLDGIDLDQFGNARKSEVTRAINSRLFDGGHIQIERDIPTSIRYACRECDATETVPLTDDDRAKVEEIGRLEPEYYSPDDELVYPNGQRFYTYRPGTESVDRLFTPRNRIALAVLRHEIHDLGEQGYSDAVVDALLLTFVAILEHVSRMQRPNKKGWAAKNYVVHPENLETNVAHTFRNRFDSIVDGMREANAELNGGEPLGDRGRFVAGDARDTPLDDGEVDYVFTDPEYGDSVQYFELSYMAASWLDTETNWEDEIVVNPRQEKRRDRYEQMLSEAFDEVFRVVRPGGYMSVTFHSREIKYWNSLVYAIQQAGFEYVDAVYQVPRKEYTNWINRRKPGTMSGDIYITFYRPEAKDRASPDFRAIRTAREAIVEEAREIILAHDGEATFDQLVRGVTLRLIEEDVMHSEQVRDFDYERIFDEHFERVGRDKTWTLTEWEDVDETDYVPLQRRIRWLVESVYADEGSSAPLDEILSRTFATLKDSRTPENEEILEVLQQVARPVERDGETVWKRRETYRQTRSDDGSVQEEGDVLDREAERRQRELDHDRIVKQLADLGHRGLGYDVCLGTPETRQSETLCTAETRRSIPSAFAGTVRERMENVDVIWFDGDEPVCLFEVEHTTNPQDGVVRMGNVYAAVGTDPVAVSVIPDSQRATWADVVRQPSVERVVADRDFLALTYSSLMTYLDELTTHRSTSLDELLDCCTHVDALD